MESYTLTCIDIKSSLINLIIHHFTQFLHSTFFFLPLRAYHLGHSMFISSHLLLVRSPTGLLPPICFCAQLLVFINSESKRNIGYASSATRAHQQPSCPVLPAPPHFIFCSELPVFINGKSTTSRWIRLTSNRS